MELEFQIYESYVGTALTVGAAFEALSPKERAYALEQNAEIMVQAAEKAGLDAIRSIGGYWEVAPGQPAMLYLSTGEDQLAQLRAIKKRIGDNYFLLGSGGAGIGIPDGDHMYEFVDSLYDEPEAVHASLEAGLRGSLDFCQRQFDEGADGVINCTDVAFNTGTFLSPAQMDEFHFPYFNRWVEGVKAAGKYAIWHTDGNLSAIMERIVQSGVHALQCIDPLAGMDLPALYAQYAQRLTLIGNIDCALLQFGPVEAIRAEARRLIDACPGGGFAIGCCNAVFPAISAAHYQALVDEKMLGY